MSGCVTCDAIREDEREEEAPHSPWDTHTVDLHALLTAKDEEIAELRKERDAARAEVEELKADIETILYECRAMGAEIEAHGSTWVPQPYVNYVSWKAYDSARRALEEGKP